MDARPSDAIALAVRLGVPGLRVGGGPGPGRGAARRGRRRRGGRGGRGGRRDRDAAPQAAGPEATGEILDRPELDIFREFVNSLDPEGDQRGRRRRELAVAGSRVRRPGSAGPGGRARSPFAHSRSRSIQKSFTARQITDGLAPVGEPGRPRVVRDADLGDATGPPPGP